MTSSPIHQSRWRKSMKVHPRNSLLGSMRRGTLATVVVGFLAGAAIVLPASGAQADVGIRVGNVAAAIRTQPSRSVSAGVVFAAPGTPLIAQCQIFGENVTGIAGRPGNSTLWDRVVYQGRITWVSDLMVDGTPYRVRDSRLADCSAYGTATPAANPAVERAVQWAVAEVHSPRPNWSDDLHHYWSGLCESYVELSLQHGGVQRRWFGSATGHYQQQRADGRIQGGVPPRGAVVFWNTGGPNGHVALSLGNGQVATTYGQLGNTYSVRIVSYTLFANYLGWARPYNS